MVVDLPGWQCRRASPLMWNYLSGICLAAEPLQRIAGGDEVWVDLNPMPASRTIR